MAAQLKSFEVTKEENILLMNFKIIAKMKAFGSRRQLATVLNKMASQREKIEPLWRWRLL